VCELYTTKLDDSYPIVLEHDWLASHNPTIDWKKSTLNLPREIPQIVNPIREASEPPEPKKPSISLINAAAYQRACRSPEAIALQLTPNILKFGGQAAQINPEEPDLTNLPVEYQEFADVFDKRHSGLLPAHRPYDLKIQTEEEATPPLGPIYSLSALELQTLREFLDENLRTGIIRPSQSSKGAPVLFVRKKNRALRLCVDYRGLNRITQKDKYPIPLVMDLLDAPKRARVYSKIDLRNAYHLVRIAAGDEWKTCFRTRYGAFEWLVMPFGLSNAPAAFQRFMNEIFADLLDVYVVIYLDDILIYSDSLDDHKGHIKEVLKRLRVHKLFASPTKCTFHQRSVEFLGFILSPEGLQMNEQKVKVIRDWPTPRQLKDIQPFLGFSNFYH